MTRLTALLFLLMTAVSGFAAEVAAGRNSNYFLRDDGTLWGWGANHGGALGEGSNAIFRSTPVQVMSGVRAVAAGQFHALALKKDGTLWAWGNNAYGQLFDGTTMHRAIPRLVMRDVLTMAAGDRHSLLVKTDGSVWAAGLNSTGQLGDGTTTNRVVPVRALLSGARSVSAGTDHSLAIKTDGSLWGWGSNSHYALAVFDGQPVTTPARLLDEVQAAFAGNHNNMVIRNDGTLWAWGANGVGQLGGGAAGAQREPIQILAGIRAVALGAHHSLALGTDGTVWAMGSNYYGALGDGTRQNRGTPVRVMDGIRAIAAGGTQGHSVALGNDGRLWAWGWNVYGQLADGKKGARAAPAVLLDSVQDMAAGYWHSLAVKTDGSLWSWGSNVFGMLGDGTEQDRAAPAKVLSDVRAVATSLTHSLAVTNDGALWGWGLNPESQLGNGSSSVQKSPVRVLEDVKSVAAGWNYSLILKTDGTLWTIGENSAGQLGDGTTTGRWTFARILDNVASVAAGTSHSLALKSDGTVWAWGYNRDGQIGDGTTMDKLSPVQVLSNVQSISANAQHSLAVANDGSLYAWGRNSSGTLGNNSKVNQSSPVRVMDGVVAASAGGSYSLALKSDGSVHSWGFNGSDVLGPVAEDARTSPRPDAYLRAIRRISAGTAHALALTGDGRLLAWGNNFYQQTGVAHTDSTDKPTLVVGAHVLPAHADDVIEYFNPSVRNGAGTPGTGRYFIASQPDEIASLDAGGSGGGWQRTGRSFRAWNEAANSPAGTVPVCRFYAREPNSHFFTAGAAECQSLKSLNPTNDAGLGWAYEGIAFHTILPDGETCASSYFPVYRAYNGRFGVPARNDGNHRLTPSAIDHERAVRFLGYVDERIAFCSPASSFPGGDLQAAYVYPGKVAQPGSSISAELLYSNNGSGSADGAQIHGVLPPEATGWSVRCTSSLGAACPDAARLSVDGLRTGLAIAAWPPGGRVSLVATGTTPSSVADRNQVLAFAATVSTASALSDIVLTNDVAAASQTTIMAGEGCKASVPTDTLFLASVSQLPRIPVAIGGNCSWTARAGAAWVRISLAAGAPPSDDAVSMGSATLTISIADNPDMAERRTTVAVADRVIDVTQAGKQPQRDAGCGSTQMRRSAEQISAAGTGGTKTFGVVVDYNCQWLARSDAPWITVISGGSGSYSAAVGYLVEANAGTEPRVGRIVVDEQAFTIIQSGNNGMASGADSGGDEGGWGGWGTLGGGPL